eukprot:EG_transcript_5524
MLRDAGQWWTLGPHNHGVGRLWRFRDGRLEKAYVTNCRPWYMFILLTHTVVMTVAYAMATTAYLGPDFVVVRWLNLSCGAVSLSLALLVACSAAAKRHAVPIHAAYCCAMVAVHCALIQLLYTAKMAEAAATWPKGLPPAEQQTLENYARRLIGYHSFLNALGSAGAHWTILAASGMSASTASSYTCALVAFLASTAATPYQNALDTFRNVVYVCSTSLGFFLACLLLERLRRSNFLAQTQLAQELQASQLADSILNHTLKNILADVEANLEVFLAGAADTTLLVDGIACLRRGMQHCKERQVYLKLAAGEYQPTPTPVRLPGLAHQLVAGRPIAVLVPDLEVLLDATLMSLILENGISNAFRHGSPQNPDVRFEVSECIANIAAIGSSGGLRHLQFIISNAAHPQRPPLTPEDVTELFLRKGGLQPVAADGVSFHIGLTHCVLAAKCGGIDLALRQEGDRVLFIASLAAREPSTFMGNDCVSSCTAFPPPRDLRFCCIDDSPAARRLLALHIQRSFPAATVHCFGASEADIASFLATAAVDADVVILDQHLEFKDEMTYGTDLVKELVAGGFGGLVCIRSANDSPEDCAHYTASGAHCVLGKDMLGPRMMEELAAAYARYIALAPSKRTPNPSSTKSSLSPLMDASCPLDLPPIPASPPWAGGDNERMQPLLDFEAPSEDQAP